MSKEINSTNSTQANFPKVAIIVLNWNGWKGDREFYAR